MAQRLTEGEHAALRTGLPEWAAVQGRDAIRRETLAARNGVGLVDVSTLGKIEIAGPDAALFLDRVYSNTYSTLPIGRARYGLMLREDGIVFDDGTTSRLAEFCGERELVAQTGHAIDDWGNA